MSTLNNNYVLEDEDTKVFVLVSKLFTRLNDMKISTVGIS